VTDDATRRRDNLDVIRHAFTGIGNADADEMLANYTDDLVLELPFGTPPFVLEGRETIRAYLKGAFAALKFRLEIIEVHECTDPDKLILEYVSQGRVESSGKEYANRYISVYWFRDGAICKVREFYDALISSQVMAEH
jgi:uncharacterized protein